MDAVASGQGRGVLPAGHLMASEMREQPEVLRRLIAARSETERRVRAVLPGPPAAIVLVARGSSDNAAIFGRYALEIATGWPVTSAAPSMYRLYGVDLAAEGCLAVAVSQSGRTEEIVEVLARLRDRGATCLAVTNDPNSPLAATGHATVELSAGSERAVPATKTFLAQLVVFAQLAEILGRPLWPERDWQRLPDAVAEVLADDRPARDVAASISTAVGLISVGRGYAFGIAREAALKLKETSGILAEGFSAADLRHGPIAVIERDFPVLAFMPAGATRPDMEALCAEVIARGAHVSTVAEPPAALPLPIGLPEPMAAIVSAVRAQQVALHLALARGLDPDAPAGLGKVTQSS